MAESSNANAMVSGLKTDDTSSGEVEEVPMPSATLDLATSTSVADKVANLANPTAETQEPITSSSVVPLGYDLSSLLTFDPESIEPATAKASEEPGPSATHGQLQHLKALLSSSIETLVADSEAVKSVLEDIQPHLPVTLQRNLPEPPPSRAKIRGTESVPARRRDGEVPPEGSSIDTTAISINAAVSHEEGVVLHRGSGLYR
ncbi:hypothetical protein QYE76_016014 [Lolium multiflorum]|uniref:Uncharacterized protein n=1 Tax=Lolium multiflorum TaxID=4521 RepID=A0AAD8X9Q0_LOLMU|nr:hypothetical protein QYE76_016014 [Lolium multiflorum]